MKKIITIIIVLLLPIACKNNNYYVHAKKGLIIRQEPDLNSNKITVIPYGEEIQINKYSNGNVKIDKIVDNWAYIDWKNNSGWAFSGYIRKYSTQYQNSPYEVVEKFFDTPKVYFSIIKNAKSFNKQPSNSKSIIIESLKNHYKEILTDTSLETFLDWIEKAQDPELSYITSYYSQENTTEIIEMSEKYLNEKEVEISVIYKIKKNEDVGTFPRETLYEVYKVSNYSKKKYQEEVEACVECKVQLDSIEHLIFSIVLIKNKWYIKNHISNSIDTKLTITK